MNGTNVTALAPRQASRIARECRRDWGRKDKYFITPAELGILLRAGAVVISINKSNDQGCWIHEVEYQRQTFCAVTNNPICDL